MQQRPIRLLPEYAMILTFDIKSGQHERYFRFISGELIPALQTRKIYMQYAWHVVYGAYPVRRIEFITENLSSIRNLINDGEWDRLEQRLKEFTENYSMRVVRYSGQVKI